MTVEEYNNITQKHNNSAISNAETKKIRSNYLYKGQLDYVKEIVLTDCPDINATDLAEKLDITLEIANLLLLDCKK